MASLTQWTWVWVNSGSWWWTGRPGMLWFMGSQRVGHDWASNWTELNWNEHSLMIYWQNSGLCFSLLPVHERTGWIFSLCSINCSLAFPNIQPGHMGQRLYFPAFSISSLTVWLCPSQWDVMKCCGGPGKSYKICGMYPLSASIQSMHELVEH